MISSFFGSIAKGGYIFNYEVMMTIGGRVKMLYDTILKHDFLVFLILCVLAGFVVLNNCLQ